MKNVMVDLETLGVRPGSIILSIGAVVFDPVTGEINNEFYTVINIDDSKASGLVADKSTIDWWQEQSEEAREVIVQATDAGRPLAEALDSFNAYILRVIESDDEGTVVWGNGANFDNVLLRAAYDIAEIEPAWSPFRDRCYRTLKELIKEPEIIRTGTHHNALDDAITQAAHAIEVLRVFKLMEIHHVQVMNENKIRGARLEEIGSDIMVSEGYTKSAT